MKDKIKRLAEGLGLKHEIDSAYYVPKGLGLRIFNPYESWADCGLVLESLMNECEKRGIEIQIMNNQLRLFDGDCQLFTGDATKDGICQARVSLLAE
jgi:hypothetical protein